jgi:polyhydroxyalkanoate synthesis regulator phasin
MKRCKYPKCITILTKLNTNSDYCFVHQGRILMEEAKKDGMQGEAKGYNKKKAYTKEHKFSKSYVQHLKREIRTLKDEIRRLEKCVSTGNLLRPTRK